jgi:pilus assembly protein CpaB
MILQDVVVLKLGNFEAEVPTTDPNATPSPVQAQQQLNPDIVTLMVSPQDSISLNYFVYSGAVLSLSLRNPNDPSRFDAESATLSSLLTQYNISLPSKLPYAMQPRLDLLTPPALPNDGVTVQPAPQQ